MSYRDLRNFSEAMRALGFPHPISLESFRRPNWQLVEGCLRWLAARVEPDAALPGGRDSRDTRVAMVAHAVDLFHSKANLKLSGVRVYGADGWAVRELLKVACWLRAARAAPRPPDAHDQAPLVYDVSARIGEIKQARALATDISAQGAFLYDLLGKEPDNREQRTRALSRPLELGAVETALRRALEEGGARAAAAREQAARAAASEAALDAKIERRRADLQRAEKRLHTVQKIKPAYAAELSALEDQLAELWEQFVVRHRVVEALKHQLSMLETAQAEADEEQQAAIMQLIHKYEAEDVLGKLSDTATDEGESSEEGAERGPRGERGERAPRPATRPKTRLRIKTAATEMRPAFGNMAGMSGAGAGAGAGRDSLDIRDEDDSQSDSDFSDRQLYGGDAAPASRWSRRPATRTLAAADDDFADLIQDMGDVEGAGSGGDSLGSSSESELRLGGSAHPPHPPPARPAPHSAAPAHSDNEF